MPITKVTEDPDVDMYTRVGVTVLFRRYLRISTQLTGLLYVKDDWLCYEAGYGRKLCFQCCKQTWHLSEVKKIEVVTRNSLKLPPPHSNRSFYLNSGLVITLQRENSHARYLVAAMNDVENFCTQLNQHISGLPLKAKSTVEMKN